MWTQKSVVGVTFDSRQALIATLAPWEELQLVRDPANPYDENAIRVARLTGEQIGFIDRTTAAALAGPLDELGGIWPANVVRIRHNGSVASILGVEIGFELPDPVAALAGTGSS